MRTIPAWDTLRLKQRSPPHTGMFEKSMDFINFFFMKIKFFIFVAKGSQFRALKSSEFWHEVNGSGTFGVKGFLSFQVIGYWMTFLSLRSVCYRAYINTIFAWQFLRFRRGIWSQKLPHLQNVVLGIPR